MFICSNANLMTLQNVGEVPRQLAYDFLQKQNGYVMLEVQNGDVAAVLETADTSLSEAQFTALLQKL